MTKFIDPRFKQWLKDLKIKLHVGRATPNQRQAKSSNCVILRGLRRILEETRAVGSKSFTQCCGRTEPHPT